MPHPFTPKEDAALLRLRAGGRRYSEIAKTLPRSVAVLRYRHARLLRAVPPPAPREPIARNCLRCAVAFQADGRFNRLCDPCRDFANGAVMLPDTHKCPAEVSHRNTDND